MESLKSNPLQGVEIAPNVRKIRMAIGSKGKGKSGGARVITLNALVTEQDGTVYLLLVYDKSDAPNVKMNVIKDIIREIGLCRLLRCERRPFSVRLMAFCKVKDGLLGLSADCLDDKTLSSSLFFIIFSNSSVIII